MWEGSVSRGASLLGVWMAAFSLQPRRGSPSCVCPWRLFVPGSSEDTGHAGSSHPRSLSELNHVLQGPFSKYSHILGSWSESFNAGDLRGTV